MPRGSLKTVHDAFTAVAADATSFGNPVNSEASSTKAFKAFVAVAADATSFGSPVSSGYQIILAITAPQTVTEADSFNLTDSDAFGIKYVETDSFNLVDSDNPFLSVIESDSFNLADSDSISAPGAPLTVFEADSFNLADSMAFGITISVLDSFNLTDSDAVGEKWVETDSFNLTDSAVISELVQESDSFNLTDSDFVGYLVQEADSMHLADSVVIRKSYHLKFSTAVSVVHQHIDKYSTDVVVQHYNPSPINDPTNPSNPADPTVVINSNYVYNTPSTDFTANFNYISLNERSVVDGCQLLDGRLELAPGGGSFSLTTLGPIAIKGAIIEVIGIKCLVTRIEREDGNGLYYRTSGLVGDQRTLNQQILLTLDTSGMQGMKPLFPNSPLQAPPSLQWTTISGAAQAIAEYAQIGLSWAAQDGPLTDTFLETGMRVVDAIQSLASRVSAFLTFDGIGGWTVAEPTGGYGAWAPNLGPGCGLWDKPAMIRGENLDFDNAFVTVPIKALGQGSVTMVDPNFKNTPPAVEPLQSYSQIITTEKLIPIPGDNLFDSGGTSGIKIMQGQPFNAALQIKLPAIDDRVTGTTIIQGNTIDPTVEMVANGTLDRNQWFPYSFPVFRDERGILCWQISPTDFPSGLVPGKFELRVGYIRNQKPIQNAMQQQIEEATQRAKLLAQYQYQQIRYFPIADGVVNLKFFGSIPLIGNQVNFTSPGGINLQGAVQNVLVTWGKNQAPKLSVRVAQELMINTLSPNAILDWYLATGGPAP